MKEDSESVTHSNRGSMSTWTIRAAPSEIGASQLYRLMEAMVTMITTGWVTF
jgi:hypothetical protein